jgi:hypothetical protein
MALYGHMAKKGGEGVANLSWGSLLGGLQDISVQGAFHWVKDAGRDDYQVARGLRLSTEKKEGLGKSGEQQVADHNHRQAYYGQKATPAIVHQVFKGKITQSKHGLPAGHRN